MPKQPPQTPPPPTHNAGLHSIATFAISASKNNPRKHFKEADLDELAASIGKVGIMQPILVRPQADGYEIVCGERRYRAAVKAGLEEVPCIVRNLTDDEAFHIAVTENLQRKDINPMEESDAFLQLTKRGKTTAAKIADMLGVGEKYVYDRLALQRCISDIQEGIRNGGLPIAIGKQFARLNLDDQQTLFENLAKPGKLLELSDVKRRITDAFQCNLANATFNIKNPTLYEPAGACTNCSKRSGCNQLLFDDVQSQDICFDKSCYDKKVQLHIDAVIKQLEAEGKTVFKIEGYWHTEAQEVLGHSEYGAFSENAKATKEYEQCNTYGVYVNTRSWQSEKDGEVVKIWLKPDYYEYRNLPMPEDVKEDIDGDEDSIGTTDGSSKREPRIDHDDEFTKHLATLLCNKYKEDWLSIQSKEMWRNELIKGFDNLRDITQHVVIETLGWELVKDEDGDADMKATIAKVYDSMEVGQHYLLSLVMMLHQINLHWWKRQHVDNRKETLASINVDLPALMDEYEQQHNHKFQQ